MKKPILILCFYMTFFISFTSWSADNACTPIADACRKLGYFPYGKSVGKGIIVDCVVPVVLGKKILPNSPKFSEAQRSQCKSVIMQKMKDKHIKIPKEYT